MLTYTIRRLFQMVLTIFIITVVGFLIVFTAPGDPFSTDLDPNSDPTTAEISIEQNDLDKPLYFQYANFYRKLFLDLGTFASDGFEATNYRLNSYKSNEPVVPTMMRRMLKTLPLFLVTTLLVWTLAFPTGIYSALRRGRPSEVGVTILSYAMISLPSFWLALLVINFVTGTMGVPVAAPQTLGVELEGFTAFMDQTWHVAVPSIIAALAGIALLSRYVKGQMLEVMHSDYVRTAKAKGLNDDVVYYKHSLRNAALPFVTMIGGLLPSLFGGSIVFEAIYAWPGLGRWSFQAVMQRDYTIVMTTLFVSSTLTLIGILISDLLYGVVDPRIKLS